MQNLHTLIVAALFAAALTGTAPVQAAEAKPDPVVLFKQVSGKDADTLKGFLADQGSASVSAAAMAGLGTTPLTVAEDTKDFAVLPLVVLPNP